MVRALSFLPIFLIGLTSAQCPTECDLCKWFKGGEMCGPPGSEFDCGGTWNLLQPNPNPRCTRMINGKMVNVCLYRREGDDKEFCFCDPGDLEYEPCKKVEWSGPHAETWSDKQCAKGGDLINYTLKSCKTECEEETGCNAINYDDSKSHCVLWKCGRPIPVGDTVKADWKGYYIVKN